MILDATHLCDDAFWDALKAAARREQVSLASLVMRIDQSRGSAGLSSAVRVWLLADLQRQAGAPSGRD